MNKLEVGMCVRLKTGLIEVLEQLQAYKDKEDKVRELIYETLEKEMDNRVYDNILQILNKEENYAKQDKEII